MKKEAWPKSRISWGRNMSIFISEPFSSQVLPGDPAGLTLKQQVMGRATNGGSKKRGSLVTICQAPHPQTKAVPTDTLLSQARTIVVNYFLFHGMLRDSASVRFVFKE